MSSNPINLAVRFLLELTSLFVMGYWGWTQHNGVLRFVLTIGLPLLAAVVWGTFRVPDDASSSGKAPVPVPGWVRLMMELGFFAVATWMLFDAGNVTAGWVFGMAWFVHYIVSHDRIFWLVRG